MPSPSTFTHLVGRSCKLELKRFGPSGAFLGEPDGDLQGAALLLLGPEIPDGARVGDIVSAFVYLDSEDRPLATTRTPKLELDDVAFLRVTAQTQFGAFVDWGLPKELLVPFAMQTRELQVGTLHAIGLYLDDSGRLAGTMRVTEMLRGRARAFEQDEWVTGEAWRWEEQIGLFVIVERSLVGLVPFQEPHGLSRGQAAKFRVTNVLPDGKLELSLRGLAHEELADDAQRILQILNGPHPPRVGDKSDPNELRDVFGLSKKAFKRAAGRLLKERAVEIDAQGYLRVAASSETAAAPAPAKKR